MQLTCTIGSRHIYFKLFVSIKIKNKHITNNSEVNTRDNTCYIRDKSTTLKINIILERYSNKC